MVFNEIKGWATMKSTTRIILVCTFLSLPLLLSGQEASEGERSLDPVLALGGKTLDAIRKKNTDFLSTVIDPDGLFVGIDTPKISAARFKRDLSQKRGVYCLIFDASCLEKKEGTAQASSLRDIILHPVVISISQIAGTQEKAVAVKDKASPNSILLTFMFRWEKDAWVLRQIEYW
jgi:hypothetical protein